MAGNINLDGRISVSLSALLAAVAVIVGAVATGSGFLAVKMDTLGRVVVESAANSREIASLKAELADAKRLSEDNNRILRERYGR